MIPFVQKLNQHTTLQYWKDILTGNCFSSFGAFAYITDSGAAQVITHLGDLIENTRSCRWVFGFDYGRSHPTALRKLAQMSQSEIRIYDGDYVVQSQGFTPRVSFHMKTALTRLDNGEPCKQIVGSGNLSASGLLSGVEAGCVIDYTTISQDHKNTMTSVLDQLWQNSVPLDTVIADYERIYAASTLPRVNAVDSADISNYENLFWVDVGYVTKNRGPHKPGNQFDLPRGSHARLGLQEVHNPALNSVLGTLKIRTPVGTVIQRSLRYGNNTMEKLTLPIPEDHGYQCYDGKILTFKTAGDEVKLQAYEHDDFFRIYSSHISFCNEMQSGRRYGTISLVRNNAGI